MNVATPTIQYAWLYYLVIVCVFVIAAFIYGYFRGKEDQARLHQQSKKISRSVLGGMFSEQVAPFLPNFPSELKASEARFVGKPVDFLIFKGMDEGNISEVVFVEVKTGKSTLSTNERKLKEAIIAKNVRWYEYHVDERVSKVETKKALYPTDPKDER